MLANFVIFCYVFLLFFVIFCYFVLFCAILCYFVLFWCHFCAIFCYLCYFVVCGFLGYFVGLLVGFFLTVRAMAKYIQCSLVTCSGFAAFACCSKAAQPLSNA